MSFPTHNLHITDLAFGGDSVARLPDGRAAFVPFTIPGEDVAVEIVSEHRRFVRARVLEVLTPAPERVLPPCPLFGRCGGCQYQHLAYSAQVAWKGRQLRSVLQRMGGFTDVPTPDVEAAAPEPFGYRNKLVLEPTRRTGTPDDTHADTTLAAPPATPPDYGFFALDNESIIPIDHCPLAMPGINALLAAAKASPATVANLDTPEPRPLTLRQPARGAAVFFAGDGDARRELLTEVVAGREVRVPAGSFWQVNPGVAAGLLATLRAWLAASPTATLIDAYAGAGAFALACGDLCSRRVLLEADRAALAAARANLEAWGLGAGEFIGGRTEAQLPRLLSRLSAADSAETTVVLDPPRGGCAPDVLAALVRNPVRQVGYVSCHAATLARDLRTLCADGRYAVRRLAWFDMFPQTAHFETAVWLTASAAQSPA